MLKHDEQISPLQMLAVITAFINCYNHLTVMCIQISFLTCWISIVSMVCSFFVCIEILSFNLYSNLSILSLVVYSYYVL